MYFATRYNISRVLSLAYLTFLMRMALSLRASSWDWILRSRFLRAKTRFSEFLMWWVCSRFISRSIPLDCIFRCIMIAEARNPVSWGRDSGVRRYSRRASLYYSFLGFIFKIFLPFCVCSLVAVGTGYTTGKKELD